MTDETPTPAAPESDEEKKARLLRRALRSPEGKILFVGLGILLAYIAVLVIVWMRSPSVGAALSKMTTTHLLGGRGAAMLMGFDLELSRTVVTIANMAIETFLVLIFYPLFVFSLNRWIVIKPLEETMERARRAAQSHRSRARKFGIIGLLLFVWFPFWMTGPLVGCVIGYLIGLRRLVNLGIVLAGTYLAIFCWSIFVRELYERLSDISPYVGFVLVAVVILLAVGIHVRYAFGGNADEDASEDADDGGPPSEQ